MNYSWTLVHELFMNWQVHELKFMNSKFMNLTNFMNMAISCSWIAHELFMNKCSWTAHELFKNHSWTVHDHFTGVAQAYLGIFAPNCSDFTICAIFTPYMFSSIETAPLCKILEQIIFLVCWSLRSLCHNNGDIETMPAREINPFIALTRIRSQFLRTQWRTIISEWTRLRLRPLSHQGWLFRAIGSLLMEIWHFKDLGDTSVISECRFGDISSHWHFFI